MSGDHRQQEWSPSDLDMAEIALSMQLIHIDVDDRQWNRLCDIATPDLVNQFRRERRAKPGYRARKEVACCEGA